MFSPVPTSPWLKRNSLDVGGAVPCVWLHPAHARGRISAGIRNRIIGPFMAQPRELWNHAEYVSKPCYVRLIIKAMESLDNPLLLRSVVEHRLIAARRNINWLIAARRVAAGTSLGLICCFPMLLLMVFYRLPDRDMAVMIGLINGVAISGALLRGPWAHGMDAAVYLEKQFNRPGLFITAAELLEKMNGRDARIDLGMEIVVSAANICRSQAANNAQKPKLATAFPRLWAVNGLLLMALLTTAMVGKAMVAQRGSLPAGKIAIKAELSSKILNAPKARESAGGGNGRSEPSLSFPPHAKDSLRKFPAERESILAARRHTAIPSLERIRELIRDLLMNRHRQSRGTTGNNSIKGNVGGGSLDEHGAKDLRSQLVAAAKWPGIGQKMRAMLIAAAHGLRASSRGNFAPRLREINRRLARYLADAKAENHASQSQSQRNAASSNAGNPGIIAEGDAGGGGQYVRSAGDSGDAVVTDIPERIKISGEHPLQWGDGMMVHIANIPITYRAAVQRYFSHLAAH